MAHRIVRVAQKLTVAQTRALNKILWGKSLKRLRKRSLRRRSQGRNCKSKKYRKKEV